MLQYILRQRYVSCYNGSGIVEHKVSMLFSSVSETTTQHATIRYLLQH